jgi:choline dehydrogenase-like flavoprotein
VIGAGASGSVVANRLSEINNWTILLLEAGAFGNDVTDIPNMEMSVLLSDYNWGYKSVPQETACLGITIFQLVNIPHRIVFGRYGGQAMYFSAW